MHLQLLLSSLPCSTPSLFIAQTLPGSLNILLFTRRDGQSVYPESWQEVQIKQPLSKESHILRS